MRFNMLMMYFIDNNVDPLTPNDPHSGGTAPLTSKRCILYSYSTNGYNLRFFLFKMQFVS